MNYEQFKKDIEILIENHTGIKSRIKRFNFEDVNRFNGMGDILEIRIESIVESRNNFKDKGLLTPEEHYNKTKLGIDNKAE